MRREDTVCPNGVVFFHGERSVFEAAPVVQVPYGLSLFLSSVWSDAYFGYFTFRKRSRIRLPGKDYFERLCHANQDAYFYDYQTHSAELYDLLNHARGIPTMLQMKAVMYLSSCYLNKVPGILHWDEQTGRKVAIVNFLIYLKFRLHQPGPHIIITPSYRIEQWRDEFSCTMARTSVFRHPPRHNCRSFD